MTDKPTTNAAAASAADDQKPDPTLTLRRVMVWVVAVILAIITSAFILQFGVSLIWPNNGSIPLDSTIPISFVNLPLLPLAAVPLTLFWMIWIDHFFRTRIGND